MIYMYYPGCSIRRNAVEYERSALAVLKALGIEVRELDNWYCCGALYSMAKDDLIRHIGAVRTLMEAYSAGHSTGAEGLLTLCPMCFNVLKRVEVFLQSNPGKLDTIKRFLEVETYVPGQDIKHFIEVVGENLDVLIQRIVNKLNGVNIAVYYGCTLLRPREIAIDDPENPGVVEEVVRAIGGSPVMYPFKSECCGSYQILVDEKIVYDKASMIISEAIKRGADIIVTLCPLCYYNLRETCTRLKNCRPEMIMYISEVLAYALGLYDTIPPGSNNYLRKVFRRQ